MSAADSLRRFRALPAGERVLLAEAVLALSAARAAVALLPFRRTAWLVRLREGPSLAEPSTSQFEQASIVGWAIRAAATRLPWQSTCLIEAIAAGAMLRRAGIPVTLHLGVAKDESSREGFAAHAWLSVGEAIIVGDRASARFTTVGSFS
jgi:hypothetical protein